MVALSTCAVETRYRRHANFLRREAPTVLTPTRQGARANSSSGTGGCAIAEDFVGM